MGLNKSAIIAVKKVIEILGFALLDHKDRKVVQYLLEVK
jgi:hypothetical protein